MATNESGSTTQNKNEDKRDEQRITIPENLETSFRPEFCISRVPYTIKSVNGPAYTPQVISIGPVHNGQWVNLSEMDIQKMRYLKEFCARFKGMSQNEVTSQLWSMIEEDELKIRHCYEETSRFSRYDFIKMILLDAVFIIELFLRDENESEYENDYIIGRPSQREVIEVDLLLLENQLPYFILTKLYNFYMLKSLHQDQFEDKHPSPTPMSFHKLACSYFGMSEQAKALSSASDEAKHFVNLARNIMLKDLVSKPSRDPVKLKYSAKKLEQAGVKFAVAENKESMLDIEFKNGVLKIPSLELHHTLESFFRNVMALEQCHCPFQTYICNYFFLMDHLINTAEDVDLLVEAGIIVNWLGSNQMVADLINKLCQGVGEYSSRYSDICEALNNHYENRWNHRKATLKLVYFSNLWRGTGTIAAALLLIMTLVQTITSVKSLF